MSQYEIMPSLIQEVTAERVRQINKWGRQKDASPETWLMIAGEEFGEICRAAHDAIFEGSSADDMDQEIVQLIAVLVAWREERLQGYSDVRAADTVTG